MIKIIKNLLNPLECVTLSKEMFELEAKDMTY
jgi:hypothetical protein